MWRTTEQARDQNNGNPDTDYRSWWYPLHDGLLCPTSLWFPGHMQVEAKPARFILPQSVYQRWLKKRTRRRSAPRGTQVSRASARSNSAFSLCRKKGAQPDISAREIHSIYPVRDEISLGIGRPCFNSPCFLQRPFTNLTAAGDFRHQ